MKVFSHFGGQLPTRVVRTLEQLPIKAVAGPVVQLSGMADRGPIDRIGRQNDLAGGLDVAGVGRERIEDGTDLGRVDAPHAGEAEFARSATSRV